jgi:hypothetical protein
MTADECRIRGATTADDFTPTAIAALFVLLMAAASIPVLTHKLPPLADYINHLARTHIIHTIDEDPFLARFYAIDWAVIPNLMIDLVVPLLDQVMSIYAAGQVFTVLAFLLIVSGTLALNRALFGRWSALPLITIPLLYNGVMLVGVMNYVFGIGLAIWMLAGWVILRERALLLRLAVSTFFVVVLFFCHLFAVGIYALGILAFELQRLWVQRTEPLAPRIVDFVASGMPFLIVGLLFFSGPTPETPGFSADWEFWGKLHGLLLAINVYYPVVGFALLAIMILIGAYALRIGALRLHPLGWAVLGVGLLIYLAMPRVLLAAHLADQRLPIALAFLLIACFNLELRTRAMRYAFVAALALLVSMRVIEVQAVWDDLSPRAEEFQKSVENIARGSRVLVVHGSGSADEEITNADLVHAASIATIERSALVSTAFTVPGKHILRVREEFEDFVETEDRWPPSLPFVLAHADRADPKNDYFWELWPNHYDYVYILFTRRGAQCPDRKHLSLVHDGPGFQLYRVTGLHSEPNWGE